jgi:hypothetical protein
MHTPATTTPAWQRQRWERIGLGVRLAYNPLQPQAIRLWLGLGERLAAQGVLDAVAMGRRSLNTLLQVAQDEGLPLAWRRIALDHAARPAVRLAALLRRDNPAQAQAVRQQLQQAQERMDGLPGASTGGGHG